MDKFDVFLEKMKKGETFCLVRFNDGEMMGVARVGAMIARKCQAVDQALSTALIEGLHYKAKDYWIGVPCPVCWPLHADLAWKCVDRDYEYLTCAVVLCNDNWQRCRELLDEIGDREVWLVTGDDQDWSGLMKEHGVGNYVQHKVPTKDSWAHRGEVMELVDEIPKGAVVMLSCGPLSRVLAHRWWKKRQDVTILDVGSTYDPFTRHVRHKCHKWSEGRNRAKYCPHCNKKGRVIPTEAFDRTIDYDTYRQIYKEEQKDELLYPKTEKEIRSVLKSCLYGVRQKKRNKKMAHCWSDVKLEGKGLELAFGFGTSLKWLTSRFDVVVDGLDFSEYFQLLVPYFKEDMGDRIGELWLGDVSDIDKPEEHYDFINSCSVFEHLPDIVYYKCLEECYRVLKDGGLMGVYLDGGRPIGEHLRMDSLEVTRKDMEEVGFEAVTDYLYRKV